MLLHCVVRKTPSCDVSRKLAGPAPGDEGTGHGGVENRPQSGDVAQLEPLMAQSIACCRACESSFRRWGRRTLP